MPFHVQSTRSLRAFTLVELTIVVVIMAVMAAIAVPRWANSIALHRIESAANRIALDLKMARERAMLQSGTQEIVFTTGTHSYAVTGLANFDRPAQSYVIKLSDEPYKVSLQSVNFGGRPKVTFDAYGVPDNSGTVVIRLGSYLRTITLDATNGIPTIS